MKKQRLFLFVLSAVVIIFAVCSVAVYQTGEKKNDKKTGLGNDVIFECSPKKITGIYVKSEEEYKLVKSEDEWFIEGLEEKEVEEKAIEETIMLLSSIKGNKAPKNEQTADFDKELMIFSKNTEQKFFFGEENKKFYLKNQAGDVYEISQALYSVCERDLNFYRDKTLECIEDFRDGEFISYSFEKGEFSDFGDAFKVRVKNEKEVQVYNGSSKYMMEKPYLKSVNSETFESTVISKLSAVSAERFIEDDPENLALYGLNVQKRGEVTVKHSGGEFTLYIGAHAKDTKADETYVMVKGENSVFTVLSANVAFVYADPFELLEKPLFTYNLKYLKSAKITYKDKVYFVENNKNKYYLNEKPISDDAFSEFKEQTEKLSKTFETSKEEGKKILDIKLVARFNEKCEYEIYQTENNKFIVCEDDLSYYLDEKSVEGFIGYLKGLDILAKGE